MLMLMLEGGASSEEVFVKVEQLIMETIRYFRVTCQCFRTGSQRHSFLIRLYQPISSAHHVGTSEAVLSVIQFIAT